MREHAALSRRRRGGAPAAGLRRRAAHRLVPRGSRGHAAAASRRIAICGKNRARIRPYDGVPDETPDESPRRPRARRRLRARPPAAQTKWDLPTAYPATNFHTENLKQFANDVDKATGGKLKITVHPNASLFKAPEIKRAVQGGQAQAGEILLVNFENEDPLFGVDGIPFLADSLRRLA